MLPTYEGVVQQGHIQLPMDAVLPEGAHVYVTVIPGIDERLARRAANRWLGEHVGDKVMAGQGVLVRAGDPPLWRFGAFVTFVSREPFGPIGHVEVNAASGAVLTDAAAAAEMIQRGERLERVSPESIAHAPTERPPLSSSH